MSEPTATNPAMLVDLPDDCILVFLQWLTIVDILCLRMTCKRMEYATRLRSVWHAIYRRFSRLIPMLPLPYPYTTEALDAVPAHVLEHISIFGYRLHLRFTQPIPSPWSVALLNRGIEEPSDDVHLLPGGRWLVEVFTEDWKVSIWDLSGYEMRRVLQTTLTNEAVTHLPTSGAVIMGRHLHVLLRAGRFDPSTLSLKTTGYVLSVELPVESSQKPPLSFVHTTRNLPRLTERTGLEEGELSVIDWTYHGEENGHTTAERKVKGLVLYSSLLDDLLPNQPSWTRVLHTKYHNYLLYVNSDGSVLLFLVPPLAVTDETNIPRVQAAPIARLSVPSVPVESVSPWSTDIHTGDSDVSVYTLSLSTPMSAYTISFVPSRTTSNDNYSDSSVLCPSTLTLVRMHLPITLDKRVSLCTLGPSGTRGVYVELSRYMGTYRELVLLAGPLPRSSWFLNSHSTAYLGDVAELEQEESTELPNPTPTRRVVFPGVSTQLKRVINGIAFDECSGRVCFKRTDGHINVMDFSAMKIQESIGPF
ncbi:hypothetical protein NM688_g7974 [Phlebia brevispora]|uniref:Uncharacterized protein n=1 Tax=Phlebia brevispora TaxID=194682 RepID=A0ACC1RZ11_9APHY|nr:hypothetical protein NM688_g7974 [Phlebia brevispora]